VSTDVSEEHIASIFKAEKQGKQKISRKSYQASGSENELVSAANFSLGLLFDSEDLSDMSSETSDCL
jgi:hypothetical protein